LVDVRTVLPFKAKMYSSMMSHDDMMGCIATEANESCCVGECRPATLKDAIKLKWFNFKIRIRNLWHWRTAWAVRHLSKQLQRDKAFRDSWHSNIAMPIFDATRKECDCVAWWMPGCDHSSSCSSITTLSSNECCAIADRLMKHLFGA
jgi:hypothetical protein